MPFDANIQNDNTRNDGSVEYPVYQKNSSIELPLQEKLVQEAEENGLEIVGKSDKGVAYKRYKFKKCGHFQDIRMSHVRENCFECKTCKENIYKLEATAKSLELVGEPVVKQKAGFRKYRFSSCDHEMDISISAVRRGNFKCTTCYNNRLDKEAFSAGLEIVGHSKKGSRYRVYKFISCGHEQEIRLDQVFSKQLKCNCCYEDRLRNEANLAGFDLVNGGVKGDTREYQCRLCGHHSEFTTTNVRNNSVRCLNCLQNTRVGTASEAGVEFVGKSNSRKKHFRFKLPCGHEKEYQWSTVKHGRVSCSVCGNTSWVNKSFVYLLRISYVGGFSWLKLGHTADVQRRIAQYGLPDGAHVEILSIIEFNSRSESLVVEKTVTQKFKQYSIDKDLMLKYHTKSGYTECFESVCASKMLEFFNGGE